MENQQKEVNEQLDGELSMVHAWTTIFVMLFMIIASALYILPPSHMVTLRIILCVGLVLTAIGATTQFLRYLRLLHR